MAKHEIIPNDKKTYNRDAIYYAVKDMFGVNPTIDCVYDHVSFFDEFLCYNCVSPAGEVSAVRGGLSPILHLSLRPL